MFAFLVFAVAVAFFVGCFLGFCLGLAVFLTTLSVVFALVTATRRPQVGQKRLEKKRYKKKINHAKEQPKLSYQDFSWNLADFTITFLPPTIFFCFVGCFSIFLVVLVKKHSNAGLQVTPEYKPKFLLCLFEELKSIHNLYIKKKFSHTSISSINIEKILRAGTVTNPLLEK